jgi:hypothetical protein
LAVNDELVECSDRGANEGKTERRDDHSPPYRGLKPLKENGLLPKGTSD